MKRLFHILTFASFAMYAHAQNSTTVSASNLTDLNQQKLAAGSMCFLGTDQNDIPISFQVGGGGQVLARPFCVPVTNGASASLLVPNPRTTQPQGIYYRVAVTDSATGLHVLDLPFRVPVPNGSSSPLLLPNPQNTQPQGIYYRVTVTDSATGQLVLRYTQVSFSGPSFNLDQYAPQYPGLVTAPGAISTP